MDGGRAGGAALHLQLLGGFHARIGECDVPEHAWPPKAAALIKLLALAPGHRRPRDELFELLWPGLAPDAAAGNLHVTLHRARRGLEPGLPAGGPSAYLGLREGLVLLCPGAPLLVDVEAFEAAAAGALAGADRAAQRAALGLYAGELLPEDRYADWAGPRREALRARRLELLLALARLEEARGDGAAALAALERAVAEEPACEAAQTGLMRLYAQAGRADAALRQYEQLRVALRRDLGAEPAPATRRLRATIVGEAAPERLHPAARRSNLPAALSSFLGRERELAALRGLLDPAGTRRLVTIAGPGGAGKTRLALEAARGLLEGFPDGVWLVELAPLAEARLVPRAVAAPLGLREEAGREPAATLAAALAGRRTLLLLDNCEHLLAPCARLAAALLAACPHLRLLATSREALGLPGETVWPLAGLAAPDPDRPAPPEALERVPAVQLYLERARAVRPDLALTAANAAAVARLCAGLDGLPLALELAAARARALPAEVLAERLDGCFALLAGNPAAPERQRSLRALVEWSQRLLTPAERTLFARLAVFAGGWTAEAAEAVGAGGEVAAGAVLGLLARLVDQSLVTLAEGPLEMPRYALLETLRRAGRELLAESGEGDAIAGHHAAYYLELAEAAPAAGAERAAWLDRLEREQANLRAALAWSLASGEATPALRLGSALWPFWQARGHLREGRDWLAAALAAGGAAPARERAAALRGAGRIARALGDSAGAERRFREALALREALAEPAGLATALDDLAAVLCERRDYAAAAALHERGLALFRQVGNRAGMADALTNLGRIAGDQGDYRRAEALHAECLALRRELGNPTGTASSLGNLAMVAYDQGDHARAAALLEEILDLWRALDDKEGIAWALNGLGLVAQAAGDLDRAVALQEESLARRRELGVRWGIAISLYGLALALTERGEAARAAGVLAECLPISLEVGDRRGLAQGLEALAAPSTAGTAAQAARLLGAAAALRQAIGAPQPPVGRSAHARTLAALRRALGAGPLAAALAAGRALAPEAAVVEALALAGHVMAPPAALPNHAVPPPARPSASPLALAVPAQPEAGLTPRERVVAELLARGLSNRQIAAELGAAERMAETHVRRVLAKLGVASRRQLIAPVA